MMHPGAPALFTKPIESQAFHVSVAAQHAALRQWKPANGYIHLAAHLEEANGRLHGPEYYRVADRMIQKLRKAGCIALVNLKWTWVTPEKRPSSET